MIRGLFRSTRHLAAALVGALAVSLSGCGGGGPTSTDATADPTFSHEELVGIRNSVGSHADYKDLLRMKRMERAGTAKVVYPSDKKKAARKN